jgi:hypothetical protein
LTACCLQSRSPVAVPPLALGEVAHYVPSSEGETSGNSPYNDSEEPGSDDGFEQQGWDDDGDHFDDEHAEDCRDGPVE